MRAGTRRENHILEYATEGSAKEVRANLYCETSETFGVGVRMHKA